MKLKLILSITIAALLLSGCTTSKLSLTPKYDEEKKTISIENMTFNNVTYYDTQKLRNNNNHHRIMLNDEVCTHFSNAIFTSTASGYYPDSGIEGIKKLHNGNCKVENISGTDIHGFQCNNKEDSSKKLYGFTQSSKKHSGYDEKVILSFDDKECYDYMKLNITNKYNGTPKEKNLAQNNKTVEDIQLSVLLSNIVKEYQENPLPFEKNILGINLEFYNMTSNNDTLNSFIKVSDKDKKYLEEAFTQKSFDLSSKIGACTNKDEFTSKLLNMGATLHTIITNSNKEIGRITVNKKICEKYKDL